jgi:hypothetical protein
VSNPILQKNFTAGGAIAAYRIVRMSAADTVVQASAATDALVGIQNEVAPASGERTDIIMVGMAFIEAGAAFALGALLTADAQGRGITAAPGAGVNNRIIGVAIDAAVAAGDIVRVQISQCSLQG